MQKHGERVASENAVVLQAAFAKSSESCVIQAMRARQACASSYQ
ncbi:hypothetical protein [Polaromonas sp. CG9_12]|nr:hypothetical protein [Polaromonas sp. CG9_12]